MSQASPGASASRVVAKPLRRLKLVLVVCYSWGLWAVIVWVLMIEPFDSGTVAVLVVVSTVSFAVGFAALVAYLFGRVLIALEVGPYGRPNDRGGAGSGRAGVIDPDRDWYGS